MSYAFANEPAAVVTADRRQLYRDPKAGTNLMTDRRVVRGNTYSAVIPTPAQQRALEVTLQNAERLQRQRALARTLAASQQRALEQKRARSPEPLPGRAHMVVQTDNVLEELVDKVFEAEATTQTDPINDRPDPPRFKAKEPGVSVATQVEDGELFDFNIAVEPLLEVLVGKCLDQALMEVQEEEEIKRLEEIKRRFEEKRDAIIADAQRLDAATQRRYEEKERRLLQEKERLRMEKEVLRKIAARTTAVQYLANLQKETQEKLEREGHLTDPVPKEVEEQFMPWLVAATARHLAQSAEARREVDSLIDAAVRALVKQRDDKRQADKEAREREEKRRKEEEEERLRQEEEAKRKKEEEKAEKLRRLEEERRKAEEEAALADEGDEGDEDGEGEEEEET